MNTTTYRVQCKACRAWMHRNSRAASTRRVVCGRCKAIYDYPLKAFIEDKGQA